MAQTSIQETLERVRTLAERSGAAEAEIYFEFITHAKARVREREVHFSNTFIPYQVFRSTTSWLTCTAVATDGNQKREGTYSDRKRIFLDLNTPERIGRKAAERALARLGAKPVPSTKAPVIFEAEAAGAFVAGLFG